MGVARGPLKQTRFLRIETRVGSGRGAPCIGIAEAPASIGSQLISAPVASMHRTALSVTSGPIPSPRSSVIVLGISGPDCTRFSQPAKPRAKLRALWNREVSRSCALILTWKRQPRDASLLWSDAALSRYSFDWSLEPRGHRERRGGGRLPPPLVARTSGRAHARLQRFVVRRPHR